MALAITGRARKISPHVLIVDDEAPVRSVLKEICEAMGWSASGVADGDEAVLAAGLRPPDLVLLDRNLQGRDGLDVLADLHAVSPGTPVVVISGDDPHRVADAVARADGAGVIGKPCGIAQLASVLERHLPPRAPAGTAG